MLTPYKNSHASIYDLVLGLSLEPENWNFGRKSSIGNSRRGKLGWGGSHWHTIFEVIWTAIK